MKRFSKSTLGLIALAAGTLVSFGGALSSTLAWFAYSTTVDIQMQGTSINETEQLQVGLKTNLTFSDALVEKFNLTQVVDGDDTYTFAAPGAGFDSSLINYYLNKSGYASNSLTPVTSGKYETGDDLNLKVAPQAGHPEITNEAPKYNYARIPFAFRVVGVDALGATIYAKNQAIWITNARAVADNGLNNIYRAVRVFFSGCKYAGEDFVENKFIFNPSAANDVTRYNNVAGLLNLNGDDYYDTYDKSYGMNGDEIVYGEYDGTLPEKTHIEEDSEIVDMNNTGSTSKITTFTAKHQGNNNVYSSLEGITPHKANFKTLSDIKPDIDETGSLINGQIVTITSKTETAIANLDTCVYIEGWDHSVVDQEIDHSFYLGLTFEINRIA